MTLLFGALYAKSPSYLVLYICKVSLFADALYARVHDVEHRSDLEIIFGEAGGIALIDRLRSLRNTTRSRGGDSHGTLQR